VGGTIRRSSLGSSQSGDAHLVAAPLLVPPGRTVPTQLNSSRTPGAGRSRLEGTALRPVGARRERPVGEVEGPGTPGRDPVQSGILMSLAAGTLLVRTRCSAAFRPGAASHVPSNRHDDRLPRRPARCGTISRDDRGRRYVRGNARRMRPSRSLGCRRLSRTNPHRL
jgi:hypothetical protein